MLRAFLVGTTVAALALPGIAQAQTFRDGVGVNVHMGYTGTAYTRGDVPLALRNLGVTHVRDGLMKNRSDQWARLSALPAKVDIVIGYEWSTITGTQTARANISNLESFEGSNEPDLHDTQWKAHTSYHQRQIWSDRGSLPVLAASPAFGTDPGAYTDSADYGNAHPYPGGNWETTAHSLDQIANHAQLMTVGKPFMATEWGYTTGIGGQPPVTEDQYRDRGIAGLLEMQKTGWTRTYIYELFDSNNVTDTYGSAEHRFGLIRSDGTFKPVATGLSWWLARIGDSVPATTSTLKVSGDAAVRSSEWLNSDGTHSMALWRNADGSGSVTVWARDSQYRPFDASKSTGLVKRASSARALTFTVGTEPVLVKVG